MNNIGILVHPFWMYLNGRCHLEEYIEILKSNRYKTLYVYLPSMTEETRRALFRDRFDSIIMYYLKVENDILKPDIVEYLIATMSNLVNNDRRYVYLFKKLIVRYLRALDVPLKDKKNKPLFIFNFLMKQKKVIVDSISDHYLQYIFYGDLSNCTIREELIYDLLKTETKTKIIPLYYGGVESSSYLSEINEVYSSIKLELEKYEDSSVDIFGEYLNHCVMGISRYLKDDEINVNIIKDKSIFYSTSLLKGGFYKQNRLGKYLAVFNPPVENKHDTAIIENWYYNKNNERIEDESRT